MKTLFFCAMGVPTLGAFTWDESLFTSIIKSTKIINKLDCSLKLNAQVMFF